MYAFMFIISAAISTAPTGAEGVMCYACNSYMAQCNFDTLAAKTNNNVFKARCTSKCFTRQGEDEAIYRGCFDAFKSVKQLTDDYVGCRNQTWNNRVRRWCLCDTDLCNRFPIEQSYQRLPHIPAHRRLPIHGRPLPPSTSKNYRKNSAEAIPVAGDEKHGQAAASYRTIWTNWQAHPPHRPDQSEASRSEGSKGNKNVGSRTRSHVVSHSVYPDQRKANVVVAVDRRHAKSGDNVQEHPEPFEYSGERQLARPEYNASRSTEQYLPATQVTVGQPAVTADRQTSHGVEPQQVKYEYSMEDFESEDDDNTTAELDLLEYPYNQEVSHQVVWTPFDDYLAGAEIIDAPRTDDEKPRAAAKSGKEDSVDYPYNQDHGALLENYDMLYNGLWKEAVEKDDSAGGEETEDIGLIVDYPYNQLFGQDASDFPILTGYYSENTASERQRQTNNSSVVVPVEHTVHTAADLQDLDVVDLLPPPVPPSSRHHIYPAAPQQHHRAPAEQPAQLRPYKTDGRLTAEFNVEETRFVPVPAALVDERHKQQPATQQALESRAAEQPTQGNVGYRRAELAKEAADSLEYVESLENVQMAPDDNFLILPTVPRIQCVHTGYYQNPKDCTQFVACLFDHNTRTKVLHLMRCPSGLVWDNVHKLCMESSSTCHAALAASDQSAPIDSYMQYFANLAAASTHDNSAGSSLIHPRIKDDPNAS